MRYLIAAAIVLAYIVFTVMILRAQRRKTQRHEPGYSPAGCVANVVGPRERSRGPFRRGEQRQSD
jgi:hypothetical protein